MSISFGASPLPSMRIKPKMSVPSCPLSRNWTAAIRADIQCKGPATETLCTVSTQEHGKNSLFGTLKLIFFPFANTISCFYMQSMIQRCLTQHQLARAAFTEMPVTSTFCNNTQSWVHWTFTTNAGPSVWGSWSKRKQKSKDSEIKEFKLEAKFNRTGMKDSFLWTSYRSLCMYTCIQNTYAVFAVTPAALF